MRFNFNLCFIFAALAADVIATPIDTQSDSSVSPSVEPVLVGRGLPLSEGGCFHGRTARSLNEEAPWNGGSVGCTYYPEGPYPKVKKYKLFPGEQGAAIQNISITAKIASMDPLQIRMTVNNTTPLPITFWKEWSPLSKRGWELGYFSIETEIWGQFFGRVGEKYRMATLGRWDLPKRPDIGELVQLDPGDSLSEIVTIPYCEPKKGSEVCKPFMWERWTEMLRLAGIKRIFIQGDWYGVWAQPKQEVMANMTDYPMDGYWTRWWSKNVVFPTEEQDEEFGTYLPLDEHWYMTDASFGRVKPEKSKEHPIKIFINGKEANVTMTESD
ncbi:hypothetical protein FPOA_08957 [Fusarium poae]|uniref:Uncharacterized protein n=1 Tax=Fusarium poae TaxID=36050 RepID=A0A1B8AQ08_FUSPO|nr:hypothetical protein FPOA_08957 [Fusarium poae]